MLDKNDLKQIGEIIGSQLKPIHKELKVLKKDVAETRNDVKTLISYFDREYVDLRKRVEAIEEHLGLPATH